MFTTIDDPTMTTIFASRATAPATPHRTSGKDVAIRLAILEALHWDLAVPPGLVSIDVSNGWVVLDGRVQRAFARHRAEWTASHVPGVVGVTNAITVDR